MEKDYPLEVNDVVQIVGWTESAFAGCFMLITEPKPWGAQGFIAIPEGREEMPSRAYYRAKWEEMEFIGKAIWVEPLEGNDG